MENTTSTPSPSAKATGDVPPSKPPLNGGAMRLALRIAADFGVTIAVPASVAALAGVRLDERFNTRPWLLILCLIVAFTLTGLWIVRKARRYKKLYEKI